MATLAPQTVAAPADWDGKGLPPEEAYGAMAADLKAARKARQAVGNIGKRINYELPGARSAVSIATARQVSRMRAGPFRDAMIAADPLWSTPDVWTVIKRAGNPITPFYLLQAMDMHVDARGSLVRVAPQDAVFIPGFSSARWRSPAWSRWRLWCSAIPWRSCSPPCRRGGAIR